MRRSSYWLPVGALGGVAALVLAVFGAWTYRLQSVNRHLSLQLEAERQRNFNEMAYHVEEIQNLLGKGLVAGSTRQNMRYMGDVQHHALAAAANFTALPLPATLSASTGKFIQQTGDFAASWLRNEAAGREMDPTARAELGRLRDQSANLNASLQRVMVDYNKGGFRWNPPFNFSWSTLVRGPQLSRGKPATGSQAPANLAPSGMDQVGQAMEKLPAMIYDGPFSDHINKRSAATAGPPVARDEAERRMRVYVPNAQNYRVIAVADVNGNLPAYSFRLAPAAATGPEPDYTAVADVSKNGGYLVQMINSRMVGKPTMDLAKAKTVALNHLSVAGFPGMVPTYGQITDGTATIAFAFKDKNVVVYPDQIKVKVALDNGEILAVDARQYLLNHHARVITQPRITARDAEERLNRDLQLQRVQLTLIPTQSGTDELLAYEFLTTMGKDTYLVYINAATGGEEQILQQIETDGGTFAF